MEELVTIPTADGFSLYSERAKRKPWWNIWGWLKVIWMCWFPGKLTESNTAEELAEKIMNGISRDHGRHWLLWMGEDPKKVAAMTDEELKEPTHCYECGQQIPEHSVIPSDPVNWKPGKEE